MFDWLDSTEPFYTECNGSTLVDLMIDIDLLESTAARTALARFERFAYDTPLVLSPDGIPVPLSILN